jgi:hypothetical protein
MPKSFLKYTGGIFRSGATIDSVHASRAPDYQASRRLVRLFTIQAHFLPVASAFFILPARRWIAGRRPYTPSGKKGHAKPCQRLFKLAFGGA